MSEDETEFDLFMSYSHADSKVIVEPLVGELEAFGFDVWYDGAEIRLGDSIPDSIDEGLQASNFGVTILSENYFEGTSQWEYDGLVTRHNKEGNVILPLWYGIDYDDVYEESPSLASLRAETVTKENIQDIAAQIYRVVNEGTSETTSWGKEDVDESEGGPSFMNVDIRFQEHFNPEIGKEVTILSWYNHNAPDVSQLEATKLRDESRGLEYKSRSHGTTMSLKRIDEEPINGRISEVDEISSSRTRFTIRVNESRMKKLPDDRDYYKAGFVP